MLPAFRGGEWLVQPTSNRMVSPQEEVRLEPRVMRVLMLLAERPGETHSREQILQSVWHDVFVSDEVLTNAIKELRKAFHDDAHNPRYIRTIPKYGYQLIPAVSRASKSEVSIRWRRYGAVAGLAVVALGLLYFLRGSDVPVSQTLVAVLPFEVRGSDDIAYLGEGMVDLMSAKLQGTGELRSVDARVVISYVSRGHGARLGPEQGRAVAHHFGAGLFVLGTVIELGGALEFDVTLYDGTGNRLGQTQVVAEDESRILGAIDDLCRRLLADQAVVGKGHFATIASHSTESFPAMKAFLEGEKRLPCRSVR
jgi:DNA-binding winged helix-turn-helix (wHTH) protein